MCARVWSFRGRRRPSRKRSRHPWWEVNIRERTRDEGILEEKGGDKQGGSKRKIMMDKNRAEVQNGRKPKRKAVRPKKERQGTQRKKGKRGQTRSLTLSHPDSFSSRFSPFVSSPSIQFSSSPFLFLSVFHRDWCLSPLRSSSPSPWPPTPNLLLPRSTK